ncbi:MAG: hypothetical protein DHS20C01_08580 [marine bacterium B5-7]|nr:MAG: hypothetical protein DHS20C01_08580 [marine bacterium B5-7]
MKTWFVSNLGDAMLAQDELDYIRSLASAACSGSDASAAKAVFMRHESEGQLHCDLKVYFSPAMIDTAQQVDATPCNRPSPEGLGLLVGEESSREKLFE